MKRYKNMLLALTAVAVMLFGTVFITRSAAENVSAADDPSQLDGTSIGYGQGRQCNENNVPLGALDFNSRYGKFNAFAVDENSNRIILTFDQGYENGYTAEILDTLKDKNVRAVFFLTGDYAEKETELVQRMIDEGHIIGNHGMKHSALPSLSHDDAVDEVMSLHDLVKEKYGYDMKLFRPPCGEYSERALSVLNSLGYKTLFWSFAYCDWNVNDQPNADEALERVVGAAHKGAVYLLHSVSETNCRILPQVIDSVRSKGYGFYPLEF